MLKGVLRTAAKAYRSGKQTRGKATFTMYTRPTLVVLSVFIDRVVQP